MKIFLSFFQSQQQHSIPAYSFWEYYIKNGIEEAGHQWVECPDVDWALGLVPQTPHDHLKWKQIVWEKTVNYIKKHPVDLVLSYLYPQQIDTSAIKEIQQAGTPWVNFYCDHVRDFKTLPAAFSLFDLNWVPEHKAIKQYQEAKYPFISLPMPMWVKPHYRVPQPEINSQITFIGSKDIQRHLLFENIVKQNPAINIAIYGSGWKESTTRPQPLADYGIDKKILFQYQVLSQYGLKGYIEKIKQRSYTGQLSDVLNSKIKGVPSAQQYNELTGASMITIGVNRYPSYFFPLHKPNTYSRLRDIEAPMLGACYLTEWTEGIETLYDIHNEIETYKTPEEFLQKTDELKNNPSKRKGLKLKGQLRALNSHSIPVSLQKILCTLGL
jgi:hypothetical protein